MTKQDKIKRFTELAHLEEISESEIINEETEEIEEIAPAEQVEFVPRKLTKAEEAEIRTIKEQKKLRFMQLIGLDESEDASTLDESSAEIPAKFIRPTKLKVTLLSEGLRKEVKSLIKEGKTKVSQFPDAVRTRVLNEMASYASAPMAEDGMAATSLPARNDDYPELDDFIGRLSLGVKNMITKELGLSNEDPEMPYKAEYIIKNLLKGLKKTI